MRFRVGEKVVYVGVRLTIWEQIKRAIHPYQVPDKNTVYTVENTYDVGDEQAIELLEFPLARNRTLPRRVLCGRVPPGGRAQNRYRNFREILRKATHKRSVDA